jgi:hypothetical protein
MKGIKISKSGETERNNTIRRLNFPLMVMEVALAAKYPGAMCPSGYIPYSFHYCRINIYTRAQRARLVSSFSPIQKQSEYDQSD